MDEITKNVEFVFTPLLTNHSFMDLARDLAFLNPVSSYSDLLRMRQLEEILGKAYLSNNYIQSLTYLDIANHVAIVTGQICRSQEMSMSPRRNGTGTT